MSDADSYDLRRKAIEPIQLDGMNKSQASPGFHISRKTIDLWLKGKAYTADDRAIAIKSPSPMSSHL